jgi:hypothetical protein
MRPRFAPWTHGWLPTRRSGGWNDLCRETVGYPHWSSECAANPSSGYTALHIQEAGLDMLLFFRCPSSGGLDVADIGDAFAWP